MVQKQSQKNYIVHLISITFYIYIGIIIDNSGIKLPALLIVFHLVQLWLEMKNFR